MFFEKGYKWFTKNSSRYLAVLFGIGITLYAVISSIEVFSQKVQTLNDFYSLLSPSLIFLIVTAIKLLAGFWIFAIFVSIFNWDHISEQGAKIFGIEINQKFNRQELDNARIGVEIVKKQIKLLSNLNDYIYQFSVTSFKKMILANDSPSEKVRSIVKNILVLAYQNNFPKVNIMVLPIDDNEINKLEPRILTPVQSLIDKDETDLIDIEYDNLGIGIHRSYEELETIIIIDTSEEGYDISLAEIVAAGNLFLSIANTIAG